MKLHGQKIRPAENVFVMAEMEKYEEKKARTESAEAGKSNRGPRSQNVLEFKSFGGI